MWFKKFVLFFLFILCTFCCCANLGFTSASSLPHNFADPGRDQDNKIQGRQHLVLGCGDDFKNETTIVGFPHDHSKETAVTMDQAQESPKFQTANPTFRGNILYRGYDNVWSHFKDEQFVEITCECVPLYYGLEPRTVRNYRESKKVSSKQSKWLNIGIGDLLCPCLPVFYPMTVCL